MSHQSWKRLAFIMPWIATRYIAIPSGMLRQEGIEFSAAREDGLESMPARTRTETPPAASALLWCVPSFFLTSPLRLRILCRGGRPSRSKSEEVTWLKNVGQ